MRFLIAFYLSFLIVVSATAAPPVQWQRYHNDTYDYSVDLPLGRFAGSAGEAGIALVENDGAGQIEVYGAANAQMLSPRQFEEALSSADRIREITYARRGSSWFVISGYYRREGDERQDLIFYAKFMFSGDRRHLSAFEASYPRSEKRRYDSIIERMEESLTSPGVR
jgi:hypothetical protein